MRTSTGLTWLCADRHGTATVAIDATTLTVQRRRSKPFGEPRGPQPGGWPGDKGFLGGTLDNTGLTHLGAREYDPVTGRFISIDPIQDLTDPQQWHGYAYANNNPTTLSDPDGLIPSQCLEECGSSDDKMYQKAAAQVRKDRRSKEQRDRANECRMFGECGGAPSIGQTIVGGEGGKVFTLDFFAYMHYGEPYSALQRWEQEARPRRV